MRTRISIAIILGIVFCVCYAISAEKEYKSFFNQDSCNQSLDFVQSSLTGYTNLIDLILQKSNLEKDYNIHVIHQNNIPTDAKLKIEITGKELSSCSGIGWELQNIGFHNHMKNIRGYIDFQEYEILKLKCEIMQLKNGAVEEIEKLSMQIEQAQKRLDIEYLDETKWVD